MKEQAEWGKECCPDMIRFKKVMEGEDGMEKKVRSHEEILQRLSGAWAFIKILGVIIAFIGATNAYLIAKLIIKGAAK